MLLYTVPISWSSVEDCFFSTKENKKNLFQNCTGEERLSNLEIISIEACLLEELRKIIQFFEEVVANFVSQERRTEINLF